MQRNEMKIYDLSQPLNQDCSFWPYYPPFEVKYIKRKAEHGVNAQYIQTSNHMGTHLDAPRHFVTNGMTIDEIPINWLYGPGAIVDLTDVMDDLGAYTPEMIEERVEIREGDLLVLHTGFHRYAQFGAQADEERYIHLHPGAHPKMVEWLLEKKIHIWAVDCISTDHPMNLPIGRFLGKGMHGHCDKVRALCQKKFGADEIEELFPDSADRQTAQEPGILTPGEPLLEEPSVVESPLGESHDGVEAGVELLDPLQGGLDHLDRGEIPGSDSGTDLSCREEGDFVHGCPRQTHFGARIRARPQAYACGYMCFSLDPQRPGARASRPLF